MEHTITLEEEDLIYIIADMYNVDVNDVKIEIRTCLEENIYGDKNKTKKIFTIIKGNRLLSNELDWLRKQRRGI